MQCSLLTLMTAEMIEKIQKVDSPPRYNHFRPNKSASRPANNSPLAVSDLLGKDAHGCRRHHMTEKNTHDGSRGSEKKTQGGMEVRAGREDSPAVSKRIG
jgi:hypothetical protein